MRRNKPAFFLEVREDEGIDLQISRSRNNIHRTAFFPFAQFKDAAECEFEARELGQFWVTVLSGPEDETMTPELKRAFKRRHQWLRRKAVRDGLTKSRTSVKKIQKPGKAK